MGILDYLRDRSQGAQVERSLVARTAQDKDGVDSRRCPRKPDTRPAAGQQDIEGVFTLYDDVGNGKVRTQDRCALSFPLDQQVVQDIGLHLEPVGHSVGGQLEEVLH